MLLSEIVIETSQSSKNAYINITYEDIEKLNLDIRVREKMKKMK